MHVQSVLPNATHVLADPNKTTSTRHMLADIDRLQLHYRAKRAEYEATLRSVGLKKGWKILDAGCGVGSFLPLMAELVGKDGHISAIALTPENIEYVESMVAEKEFSCSIEPRVGNVLSLPIALKAVGLKLEYCLRYL